MTTTATKLKCCLCLKPETSDNPVVMRLVYVGGKGDELRAECENRTICWERWNRDNKLSH
jgi:hypothetical protein